MLEEDRFKPQTLDEFLAHVHPETAKMLRWMAPQINEEITGAQFQCGVYSEAFDKLLDEAERLYPVGFEEWFTSWREFGGFMAALWNDKTGQMTRNYMHYYM